MASRSSENLQNMEINLNLILLKIIKIKASRIEALISSRYLLK